MKYLRIFGEIPSYYVADFSASYKWKSWKLEAGVTNFTNNSYFTEELPDIQDQE
jgi:Fe(3+) dicitrate transport protein